MILPFTIADLHRAMEEWGCNCGPSALAFAIRSDLETARRAIPDFDRKRYTSPSMMKTALVSLRRFFTPVRNPTREAMFPPIVRSLVRIQFTGPWTQPGVNPKAAYCYTHWIATFRDDHPARGGTEYVFDVNCGVVAMEGWCRDLVPLLIPRRGDGGWVPTHIWRIPAT